MAWKGPNNWLSCLPPEARQRVWQIQDEYDPRGGHLARRYYSWSVRVSPSIGAATDADVIARSQVSKRTWPILRHGQLVQR
jgi:hypothetical protein